MFADDYCRWSAPVTRLITRGSPGSFHGFRPNMDPTAIDHILFGPSIPERRRWVVPPRGVAG
jgi:hypothetical protein